MDGSIVNTVSESIFFFYIPFEAKNTDAGFQHVQEVVV